MNKKGFTLTEVIAVIIVLGLIGLLAFPQLLNLLKNNEKRLDEHTKTLINTAASQYTNKYVDDFPKKNTSVYCITLNDLVKEQFLSKEILDLPLTTKVKISVNSDLKYEYSVDNNCTYDSGARYAFGEPTATSPMDWTELKDSSNNQRTVFVSLTANQKSVCILNGISPSCFKINNTEEEQKHIMSVFGTATCNTSSTRVDCSDGTFKCFINNGGRVTCDDLLSHIRCDVYANGTVDCH